MQMARILGFDSGQPVRMDMHVDRNQPGLRLE